jgi:flagellin
MKDGSAMAAADAALTFHVGANASDTLTVTLTDIGDVAKAIEDIDVTAAGGATAAITSTDAQIKTVSDARATLGASQNRLEHTIKSLNVSVENLTASESRIRDTDMALEMVNFTKNQILSQAGTAMLAQANQLPQGVLQLLR